VEEIIVFRKRGSGIILYAPHFFRGIFGFSPMIGCSDMVQEAIAKERFGKQKFP